MRKPENLLLHKNNETIGQKYHCQLFQNVTVTCSHPLNVSTPGKLCGTLICCAPILPSKFKADLETNSLITTEATAVQSSTEIFKTPP